MSRCCCFRLCNRPLPRRCGRAGDRERQERAAERRFFPCREGRRRVDFLSVVAVVVFASPFFPFLLILSSAAPKLPLPQAHGGLDRRCCRSGGRGAGRSEDERRRRERRRGNNFTSSFLFLFLFHLFPSFRELRCGLLGSRPRLLAVVLQIGQQAREHPRPQRLGESSRGRGERESGR